MKKLQFGVIAVALAVAFSAFTTPGAKTDTEYWVYTSPTNSVFQDAYKYEQQTLSSESQANCPSGNKRPCVLGEVDQIGSDTADLHDYLATQGQGSTANPTQAEIDQHITESSDVMQSQE